MNSQELIEQYGIWIFVLINVGIGLVLGLIPLTIGLIKGRAKYGVFGFAACLVGGAILGVFLSIPACVFFSWLAIRQPKPAASIDEEPEG